MKASRKLLAVILALVVGTITSGCGGSEQPTELNLANIGWDENIAVSNLTKVLLEDELGYDKVKLKRGSPEQAVREVASGDLDAFQDLWMPMHKKMLRGKGEEVGTLDTWLIGTTRSSLAVPHYVKAKKVPDLRETEVDTILGVQPEAAAVGEVYQEADITVVDKEVLFSNAPAMLDEVNRLYEARKPFAFVAWSPHWMNLKYNIVYLTDPQKRLEELTRPSEPLTIHREGLAEEEPKAYRLMRAITLTDYQVSSLELKIQNARSPTRGARKWADDHRTLIEEWVEKAEDNAGSG